MFPEFYRMIDELRAALVGIWKPAKVNGIRAQWREIENGIEIKLSNDSPYDVRARDIIIE